MSQLLNGSHSTILIEFRKYANKLSFKVLMSLGMFKDAVSVMSLKSILNVLIWCECLTSNEYTVSVMSFKSVLNVLIIV
jgi:hypothetical protein